MFAQQLFSKDLTGSLLEAITSIRRPIYTYLYVHILIVFFSFVSLQNVKNKCTCVDVERFKDMFANSKRLLAVATTACRPGFYSQPSICLLFLSFLFCYALKQNINQQMYVHGLIHLRPSDEHFFISILLNQKYEKALENKTVVVYQ